MKRWSVLLISCFALLAIPALASAADVILPNGDVYRSTDDGVYNWIPDVATANAMGLDWNNLEYVDELPGPNGESPSATQLSVLLSAPAGLTTGASITRANGNDVILPDGSVYQLDDDGVYHWIPDLATANAMGLDWDNINYVDELPGPAGDPFPSVG